MKLPLCFSVLVITKSLQKNMSNLMESWNLFEKGRLREVPRVLSLELCVCIIHHMEEFGTKSKICTNYFEKECT